MEIVWPIIIGAHLCSLLFLTIYLRKLFVHVRKYPLTESKYTLLFGWIQLRYIISAYIIVVAGFIIVSTLLLQFLQ